MRLAAGLLALATIAASIRITDEELQEIRSSRKLKVIGRSDDPNHEEQFQKFCFTIGIEDKSKKIAYQQSVQRLSKIQRYFRIKNLIPDQASLTIRKVEARLNRKRRVWNVLKTACFLSEIDQQRFIEKSLRELGVRHYRALRTGSYLNEREMATKAFNNAKAEALEILDRIGYKLRKVSNIEILGHHVLQEEKLEEQIQDQFNEGEDSEEQRASTNEQDKDEIGVASEQIPQDSKNRQLKPITVSVMFEVQPQDEQEESESTESEQL